MSENPSTEPTQPEAPQDPDATEPSDPATPDDPDADDPHATQETPAVEVNADEADVTVNNGAAAEDE